MMLQRWAAFVTSATLNDSLSWEADLRMGVKLLGPLGFLKAEWCLSGQQREFGVHRLGVL